MPIVTVNVTQQVGSTPNKLQKTGTLVSCGGTSLVAGSDILLTQLSDLTSYLAGAISIVAGSTTWAAGVVTVTTATAHGFSTGDSVTIAGFVGTGYVGYNGTYNATVTDAESFTYAQASTLTTPATGTAVATDADVSELLAMATTFFAQGSSLGVYVLEVGHGTIVANIAEFASLLSANPLEYYAYLIPRGWDAQSTFVSLCLQYNSTTAKQYFCVTATTGTYTSFTALQKAVGMLIEAPGIPETEFSMAARFWNQLKYSPSSANPVTPLQYAFVYGVTPYPATTTQQTTWTAANLDWIGTGAEGGISNALISLGTQCDGNPLNYWYSIDWMQINLNQSVSAAVINGSNNPLAPLYYNQQGINSLEGVATKTVNQGVSYGLALGPVTVYQLTASAFTALIQSGTAPLGVLVNAVPFASWVALNPSTYSIGNYGGLVCAYTPARGFATIMFNISVSNQV
jgi:hypothetical protein